MMIFAYSRLGMMAGWMGLHALARYYLERARSLAPDAANITFDLERSRADGFYHYAIRADFQKARAILTPLLERCLSHGDAHQIEATYIALAHVSSIAGDGLGKEHAARVCASAEQAGHSLHGAWGRMFWGWHELHAGRFSEAVSQLERAEDYFRRNEAPSQLLDAIAGIAEAKRRTGDLEGALDKLAETRAMVREHADGMLICIHYNMFAPDIYLDAWSRAKERGEPERELAELAKGAYRSARRAARVFHGVLPAALRAAAHIAALEGSHRRASRLFSESMSSASELAMPFQEAVSAVKLGKLAIAAPLAERRKALERAIMLFRRHGHERAIEDAEAARRSIELD